MTTNTNTILLVFQRAGKRIRYWTFCRLTLSGEEDSSRVFSLEGNVEGRWRGGGRESWLGCAPAQGWSVQSSRVSTSVRDSSRRWRNQRFAPPRGCSARWVSGPVSQSDSSVSPSGCHNTRVLHHGRYLLQLPLQRNYFYPRIKKITILRNNFNIFIFKFY